MTKKQAKGYQIKTFNLSSFSIKFRGALIPPLVKPIELDM
ncbi:hypothetical protein PEDI_23150 [Persicobacter diffluens]|uniref:Uncharacterized protein n=1 Tax=Persicobacter diffluens TaxID=981 RepID=A0AAN4VXY6_9BACT|nr:hypothetical protein PEDI_23150 [Persicobacter diffluens]